MKTTEDLATEYLKEIHPTKKFLRIRTDEKFGSYFEIVCMEESLSIEEAVEVGYLDFITWVYNRYIAPEKIYINLN